MEEPLEKLRLIIQSVIAIGVLGGATYLAQLHIINSDATVALYGAVIGIVGQGAAGGIRERIVNGGKA